MHGHAAAHARLGSVVVHLCCAHKRAGGIPTATQRNPDAKLLVNFTPAASGESLCDRLHASKCVRVCEQSHRVAADPGHPVLGAGNSGNQVTQIAYDGVDRGLRGVANNSHNDTAETLAVEAKVRDVADREGTANNRGRTRHADRARSAAAPATDHYTELGGSYSALIENVMASILDLIIDATEQCRNLSAAYLRFALHTEQAQRRGIRVLEPILGIKQVEPFVQAISHRSQDAEQHREGY